MGKKRLSVTALIAATVLPGCYKTVGPVVTSVRLDKSGAIHYSRCNLVVGSTWFWIPDADLEDCVSESHESLEAPGPLHQHAAAKEKD